MCNRLIIIRNKSLGGVQSVSEFKKKMYLGTTVANRNE
jgi:hypothetical protein